MFELEYNQVIEIAVRKVLPMGDKPKTDVFIKIFSEPFSALLNHAVVTNHPSSALILLDDEILKRFSDYLSSNPAVDRGEYINYFYKVTKGLLIYANESGSMSDEIKYAYNKHELSKISGYRLIHGELQILDECEKYINDQLIKLNPVDKSISFIEHLKQINELQTFINPNTIKSMDSKLRPEFIEDDEPPLLPYLAIDRWKKNRPFIDWKKSQASLLYLFYKLNNNDWYIPGGKLSEFISLTFTVKKKTVTETNMGKLLSRVSSYYKSPETEKIDALLKSIGA